MPSPIEILIDRACGLEEPHLPVLMKCRVCLKEKRVPHHETDPKGTAEIIFNCPQCSSDTNYQIRYYTKSGQPLSE